MICYQEADRIADCLRSLSFCDEVVVVDSGSQDGTREIAQQLGARVILNAPFPGHKEQKQFAIEQARNDWVFCLDADERATPALQSAIVALFGQGLSGAGYEMPRHNHYLGASSGAACFGQIASCVCSIGGVRDGAAPIRTITWRCRTVARSCGWRRRSNT